MGSLPQVHRDLREGENHLRFTRHRLSCDEALTDRELAAPTSRVTAGLEETKQVLVARSQNFTHAKA